MGPLRQRACHWATVGPSLIRAEYKSDVRSKENVGHFSFSGAISLRGKTSTRETGAIFQTAIMLLSSDWLFVVCVGKFMCISYRGGI